MPACTGDGLAVFSGCTSATAVTVLVTELLLLPWVPSPMSGERTAAVFEREPVVAIDGRTITVTVAVAPLLSVPSAHDKFTDGPALTPEGVHEPWLGVADCKPPVVIRLPSVSVSVTLLAASGPLLRTVMT